MEDKDKEYCKENGHCWIEIYHGRECMTCGEIEDYAERDAFDDYMSSR